MSFIKDLEFDLPSALLTQLVDLFQGMERGPLTIEAVDNVPNQQGVYQLFLDDTLVYVGKTDADAGLQHRLYRHARKIRSRLNLDPSRISFKAVRVYVFTAMDLEELLIKHYRAAGVGLAWNFSGFGSNDPGRNRDKSKVKNGHFDNKYPIDLDLQVNIALSADNHSVAEVLRQLKTELPYTIRYQNRGGSSKKPHMELVDANANMTSGSYTVRHVLRQVKGALNDEWQITALPGYVIVYKEHENYWQGEVIQA